MRPCCRWIVVVVMAGACARAEQRPKQNDVFRTTSQFVIEHVEVRAADGAAAMDLKASDFVVTEDGAPQTIRLFEAVRLDSRRLDPVAAKVAPLRRLPIERITTRSAEEVRGQRLLVFYFDGTTMDYPARRRALDAAQRFVALQMTESDRVAVVVYDGGAPRVVSDFANDRTKLLAILRTLLAGEDESAPGTVEAEMQFGQNDEEFNVFFTDRQLAALQSAMLALKEIPARKALVYFSSGLKANGLSNQSQLQAAVQSALSAGVTVWPVDSRGLDAAPPAGDASQVSPTGLSLFTGRVAESRFARQNVEQDTLWTLGAETGGKALLNSNDLGPGIINARDSIADYYVLGYYSTNPAEDGKYRRVEVKLRDPLGASLVYRRGYYAPKQFGKFTGAEKERQLEEALMLGVPVTALRIALEIDYFQLNRAEYFTQVTLKIPGREMVLARRMGAYQSTIDFIGEVRDDSGATVSNVRDRITLRLDGTSAGQLPMRPVEYDAGFTLLPGNYRIKMLARENVTGRIGTFEAAFVVPNLNRVSADIPISSVVLSSQSVDLRQAHRVKGALRSEEASPLVDGGSKILPSVTRVFRVDQAMTVFLEAYQQGESAGRPLLAQVALYRGSVRAATSVAIEVARNGPGTVTRVPLRLEVPLRGLAPGQYQCQVTVLDRTAQKTAFWRAPIQILE